MSENQNTKSVESIEVATIRAMQEVAKVEVIAGHWRARAHKAEKELTRKREIEHGLCRTKGKSWVESAMEEPEKVDGQPIHYWHSIATSTLKTNNELIDRVKNLNDECDDLGGRTRTLEDALREKERINADLEHKLQAAVKTAIHQQRCAEVAENERDAALRELDAMREKRRPTPEPHSYFVKASKPNMDGARVQVTKEAFFALRDSAPKTGNAWTVDTMRPNESTLTIYV